MTKPSRTLGIHLCVLVACLMGCRPTVGESAPQTRESAESEVFTVFVAGDTIITQPWSGLADGDFSSVAQMMRDADVTVVNLETTIGNFMGSPQAKSSGSYFMVPPIMARELAWAGIDMVGGANNHTFDYGTVGVLETVEHVRAAGLALAGAGEDAQRAIQPAFHEAAGRKEVALVSMTSTFPNHGVASPSRSGLEGRPGLNPLTVHNDGPLVRLFVYSQRNLLDWLARTGFAVRGIRIRGIDETELNENLRAVTRAARRADYVVLSIHAHGPGVWIEDFARQAIDAGADVLFSHGPHSVSGVEVYNGRPIFYGLGNFCFQPEQLETVPAEAYRKLGLDPDAGLDEYFRVKREREGRRGNAARRELWEGTAAIVKFAGGELSSVKIIPLDLGADRRPPRKGVPFLADADLGEEIVARVADRSLRYGTRIWFQRDSRMGLLQLD